MEKVAFKKNKKMRTRKYWNKIREHSLHKHQKHSTPKFTANNTLKPVTFSKTITSGTVIRSKSKNIDCYEQSDFLEKKKQQSMEYLSDDSVTSILSQSDSMLDIDTDSPLKKVGVDDCSPSAEPSCYDNIIGQFNNDISPYQPALELSGNPLQYLAYHSRTAQDETPPPTSPAITKPILDLICDTPDYNYFAKK